MEIHSRQTKTGETDNDDGIAGISIHSVELYRQTNRNFRWTGAFDLLYNMAHSIKMINGQPVSFREKRTA